MGSRASTLLRDEELEEIKKETGCELVLGGGNAARRLWLASGTSAVVAEVWTWGALTLRGLGQPPAPGIEGWRTCPSSCSLRERGCGSCGAVLPLKA